MPAPPTIIGAIAAIKGIAAVAAEEEVVATAPSDHIVAVPAQDRVGLIVAFQKIVECSAVDILDGDVHITHGVAAGASGDEAQRDAGGRRPEHQGVEPYTAINKIGACATVEHIVAPSPPNSWSSPPRPSRTSLSDPPTRTSALSVPSIVVGMSLSYLPPHHPVAFTLTYTAGPRFHGS